MTEIHTPAVSRHRAVRDEAQAHDAHSKKQNLD
jgi:hypothetical protein